MVEESEEKYWILGFLGFLGFSVLMDSPIMIHGAFYCSASLDSLDSSTLNIKAKPSWP
jgi:hypothetical protein